MGIANGAEKQQQAWQDRWQPLSAAEVMLGDLPAGVEPRNYRDTAGPAESQLYLDELDDEAYSRYAGDDS